MTITVNAVRPVHITHGSGDRRPDRATFFMELGQKIAEQARQRKEQAAAYGLRSVSFEVGENSAVAVTCAINILQDEGLSATLNNTKMVLSW